MDQLYSLPRREGHAGEGQAPALKYTHFSYASIRETPPNTATRHLTDGTTWMPDSQNSRGPIPCTNAFVLSRSRRSKAWAY